MRSCGPTRLSGVSALFRTLFGAESGFGKIGGTSPVGIPRFPVIRGRLGPPERLGRMDGGRRGRPPGWAIPGVQLQC